MKMFKKLLFAGLAFTTLSLQAQTADEIIAKSNAAMGGLEKIKTLASTKKSGTMSAQGQEFPIVMTTDHMKGMRLDLEIMGNANYMIYTMDKGYRFFPIQGMTEPQEMDAEAVIAGQGQLDAQGILVDAKEKGATIEYVGNEKVDGADAYKLKVTRKSGKSGFYFIDTKTNFLVKSTGKSKGPDGVEVDTETTYSNYKQNKDGFWFAYTIITPNGPMNFDSIESNVKVDESIFKN